MYMYTPPRDTLDAGFPSDMLDGTFAPLDTSSQEWKLTHMRYNHHVVSVLSRHDNTIDKRPGSNASFVVEDAVPWDEAKILASMKVYFPDCWERLCK